jgi:hypothetical protein
MIPAAGDLLIAGDLLGDLLVVGDLLVAGDRDFNRLIAYAVADGKKAALALQFALTEVALNDFFVNAFGQKPLTIDDKRRLFYEAYAAAISPENWREMDGSRGHPAVGAAWRRAAFALGTLECLAKRVATSTEAGSAGRPEILGKLGRAPILYQLSMCTEAAIRAGFVGCLDALSFM